MNSQQRKFIEEYRKSPNATRAAILAGYSERTAYSQGSRLLKNPAIMSAILSPDGKVQKNYALTRTRSNLVYLIQECDTKNVKIGIANDIEKRLSGLQTGNSQELIVFAYFEIENPVVHEKHLHKRFAHKLVRGEWYKLTQDDLNMICNYLGGYTLASPIVSQEITPPTVIQKSLFSEV